MLSSDDIVQWFERLKLPKPDIIRYPDLDKVDPEELKSNVCKFLLYEQFERFGHWCIFFYSDVNQCFIFFDPYGIKLDDELKHTYHKEMLLTKKLLDMDNYDNDLSSSDSEDDENVIPIDYNEYRYQADETSTCGRLCSIRYLMDYCGMSTDEFKKAFYDGKTLEQRDLNMDILFEVLDEINKNEQPGEVLDIEVLDKTDKNEQPGEILDIEE